MSNFVAADVTMPEPADRMEPGLRALPPPGGMINPTPPPSYPVVTPPPPPVVAYPPTGSQPDVLLVVLISAVVVVGFVSSFVAGYLLARLKQKNSVDQVMVPPRMPVTNSTSTEV